MTTTARVRMSPDTRRAQLLELGVQVLSTRSLEELSIDVLAEVAGISRGLLYHYFGNKQEFHEAVVRRAVEDLIEVTAPVDDEDMMVRLRVSLDRYLAYVEENHTAYVSILRAAQGGNAVIREIYESARNALTDRIFDAAGADALAEAGVRDTPGARMIARGWAVLVEQVGLEWMEDSRGIAREALLDSLTAALAALLPVAPEGGA